MKKTPALLLIDIQNDYFPGGLMALEGMEAAAAKAAELLAEFRARDWPRFRTSMRWPLIGLPVVSRRVPRVNNSVRLASGMPGPSSSIWIATLPPAGGSTVTNTRP